MFTDKRLKQIQRDFEKCDAVLVLQYLETKPDLSEYNKYSGKVKLEGTNIILAPKGENCTSVDLTTLTDIQYTKDRNRVPTYIFDTIEITFRI